MPHEPMGGSASVSAASRPLLSIVVPCLNEETSIAATLDALAPLRRCGAEVIVVDGGSSDETAARAASRADHVIASARGRATQMNAGAALARGDVLLFLHADTKLPPGADALLLGGLAKSGCGWGRFDVTISGAHPLFPVIAGAMNLRSRWTGIATGDQGIFVARELFERVRGYPPIALMEDIALSALLRRHGPPYCIRARATTSGRRWEKHGVFRTMLLMWRLRLAYALGADPTKLALRYVSRR
jgi:rSAM/selenodomain-associated transferase 2